MRAFNYAFGIGACLLLSATVGRSAESLLFPFTDNTASSQWELKEAAIDTGKSHSEGSGSLKVSPGGQAILPLRAEDGSGLVEFWIYDDATVAAQPKSHRAGPRWGVRQKDGRVLACGILYAPYLAGDTSYALSEVIPPSAPTKSVVYLGIKRTSAWHKWVFDFDAQKGLVLSCDDKVVDSKRFDWNKSQVAAFNALIIFGDETGQTEQTIWVDDIAVTLGGAMQVKPVPPPPPPPVVPEKDPALTEAPPSLVEKVRGKHPRLLFTANDIPALRAKSQTEKLKPFLDKLNEYVPSCVKPPTDKKFVTNATEAIREGVWRMPPLAMKYVLTEDPVALEAVKAHLALLLETDQWEAAPEVNSGMGAANIMIGAALAYDWTYNSLDPEFREKFRKKLIYQSRALYYGGHLMKNPGVHYWQNDPGNNHRWHRDAGFSMALLAAYEGNPEEQWILSKLAEEMKYIAQWLPPDGSCHDGSTYLAFGTFYLVIGIQATDHCMGTSYLRHPFFRNVTSFATHTQWPGLSGEVIPIGDASGAAGWNTEYVYALTGMYKQADIQAAQLQMLLNGPHSKEMFHHGWFGLLWMDPTLEGDFRKLPCTKLFPDIGTAIVREGWDASQAAAMFKCGPLGGVTLNHFRNSLKPRGYINVAHDDEDANSFILYREGFLAETDRYSYQKISQSLNTILVNGKGQGPMGRPVGPVKFTQPASPDVDMLEMAYLTAYKDAGDVVILEGEASGAYQGQLERFRRHFIWVKQGYVLVIDDIRAKNPSKITWLMQGPKLEEVDAAARQYKLANAKVECPFVVLPFVSQDTKVAAQIGISPADDREKPLHWPQLQLNLDPVKRCQLVSAFDLWGRTVRLSVNPGTDQLEITVTGSGFSDSWHWEAAKDAKAMATLTGKTKSGVVEVTAKDLPPAE